MDTAAFRKGFYSRLEEFSKASGLKYSKNSFCAYSRMGEIFWKAEFLCGFFLRDGQLEVTVVSRVKPLDFDAVQFSVIDPGKPRRITDTQRVTASFAARGLPIGKTVCRLPCAGPADPGEEQVQAVLRGVLEERDSFLGSQALEGGLSAYLVDHWEKHPYEAGMAHLCGGDWDAAERCFRLAGETGRFDQLSIGRPGRYLYLLFIDYCRAMRAGASWSEELAVNGFPG